MSETLYGIALEGPGEDLRTTIAYRIAEEALLDPEWRTLYDELLDHQVPHPEQNPVVLSMTADLPARLPGHTLLGGRWTSLANASAPLTRLMCELGVPQFGQVPDVSLAAGVIAAELWCGTLLTSDLKRAASLGPCSVRALSTACALAAGESGTHLHQYPAVDVSLSGMAIPDESLLRTAIDHCLTHATVHLGPSAAESAAEIAFDALSAHRCGCPHSAALQAARGVLAMLSTSR